MTDRFSYINSRAFAFYMEGQLWPNQLPRYKAESLVRILESELKMKIDDAEDVFISTIESNPGVITWPEFKEKVKDKVEEVTSYKLAMSRVMREPGHQHFKPYEQWRQLIPELKGPNELVEMAETKGMDKIKADYPEAAEKMNVIDDVKNDDE